MPPNPNDESLRRLERRLEHLEMTAERENRWWRAGLIAALVLIALSILIAGHHRHHPPPMRGMGGPMGMQGWDGPRMMPYGPPPPPYWGYGYGQGRGFDGPPDGWHHHHRNDSGNGPGNGPGGDEGPQGPKG
jgi:hypothetical protein